MDHTLPQKRKREDPIPTPLSDFYSLNSAAPPLPHFMARGQNNGAGPMSANPSFQFQHQHQHHQDSSGGGLDGDGQYQPEESLIMSSNSMSSSPLAINNNIINSGHPGLVGEVSPGGARRALAPLNYGFPLQTREQDQIPPLMAGMAPLMNSPGSIPPPPPPAVARYTNVLHPVGVRPQEQVNVGSSSPPPPNLPPPPTDPRDDDEDEWAPTYKIPSLADHMYDDTDDRPTKKAHMANDGSPYEKLISHQYLKILRELEAKLKRIRAGIIQREFQGLVEQINEVRTEIDQYIEEFDRLKSNHYLRAGDFNTLLSLEEFLTTTLSPQLALYELDYKQITNPSANSGTNPEVPVCLSIVSQETAGPIFKEKAIGPFTLRLLTGATITQIQSGPVQPKLVDTSQRIKRNNQELENAKQNFKENGTATFTDLKFSSGTFPNLVRLKFRVTIQILVNSQKMTKTIESAPTKPFVSMTNTGSQWKDAAGTWLKEELFPVDTYEVSLARLWNYFQKHYLISTKQELSNIKRPLFMKDFEYLLRCRFRQGTEKQNITLKEFSQFWDLIGPALKKIRYQKYLLWLFENGYLCAFVTSKEAEENLQNEALGTFIIRLSERLDGELVISYVHGSGIRHYLVQGDDTADKKKTLIDFLGQNKIFVTLLQITTQPNGKRVFYRHNKDKVLSKYYKKLPKQSSMVQPLDHNPYDTRLPADLHNLL